MKKNKKSKKKKKHKRHYYYDYPVFKKGLTEPVFYGELNDEGKKEVKERMYELISEFIGYSDYIPDDDDTKEILKELCEEISQWYDLACYLPDKELEVEINNTDELDDDFEEEEQEEIAKELTPDNDMRFLFSELLEQIIQECREDGFDPPTYLDSLVIAETERLKLRRFVSNDLMDLWGIMKKPEVMYSWDRGFRKNEVKKWINQQFTRYQKDKYGYFAVILKESGRLIGQTGLFTTNINGNRSVEIGYIFDNSVWGKGYCGEAVKTCVEIAFEQLGIDKLYCAIRPDNEPAIKVVQKLGMTETGECVQIFDDKEIPHLIYI